MFKCDARNAPLLHRARFQNSAPLNPSKWPPQCGCQREIFGNMRKLSEIVFLTSWTPNTVKQGLRKMLENIGNCRKFGRQFPADPWSAECTANPPLHCTLLVPILQFGIFVPSERLFSGRNSLRGVSYLQPPYVRRLQSPYDIEGIYGLEVEIHQRIPDAQQVSVPIMSSWARRKRVEYCAESTASKGRLAAPNLPSSAQNSASSLWRTHTHTQSRLKGIQRILSPEPSGDGQKPRW